VGNDVKCQSLRQNNIAIWILAKLALMIAWPRVVYSFTFLRRAKCSTVRREPLHTKNARIEAELLKPQIGETIEHFNREHIFTGVALAHWKGLKGPLRVVLKDMSIDGAKFIAVPRLSQDSDTNTDETGNVFTDTPQQIMFDVEWPDDSSDIIQSFVKLHNKAFSALGVSYMLSHGYFQVRVYLLEMYLPNNSPNYE